MYTYIWNQLAMANKKAARKSFYDEVPYHVSSFREYDLHRLSTKALSLSIVVLISEDW